MSLDQIEGGNEEEKTDSLESFWEESKKKAFEIPKTTTRIEKLLNIGPAKLQKIISEFKVQVASVNEHGNDEYFASDIKKIITKIEAEANKYFKRGDIADFLFINPTNAHKSAVTNALAAISLGHLKIEKVGGIKHYKKSDFTEITTKVCAYLREQNSQYLKDLRPQAEPTISVPRSE